MMTTFLKLLGNFPYRGLPPLYLRKSARFLGQCIWIDVDVNMKLFWLKIIKAPISLDQSLRFREVQEEIFPKEYIFSKC
jgi:hypothetical protein